MTQSRSALDIVWSCLSTLFLCTWVAFHPDIPASRTNSRGVVSRFLTTKPVGPIVALLVPELVLAAALGQWLNQRNALLGLREWELSRGTSTYQNTIKDWTATHAFLHEMEGFRLIVHPSSRSRSPYFAGNCHARDLLFLAKRQQISLPEIENDIRDRSKGDWVSKAIAIFQAVWFLIQFAARAARGLPITELEISTVGFVIVALSTYALWWHKPQGVNIPIAIHISETEYSELIAFRDREFPNSRIFQPMQPMQPTQPIQPVVAVPQPVTQWAVGPVSALARPAPRNPRSPVYAVRVPDVPVTKHNPSLSPGLIMWWCLALVGFVLGGIHCAAWSFQFPTTQERTGWRICSVIVTVIPPVLTTTFIYIWMPLKDDLSGHSFRGWFSYIVFGLLFVIYLAVRVALLVEAFLCLRSMPSGVHQIVQWTTFLPHI